MSKQVNVFKDEGLMEIIYAGEVTLGDLVEDRNLGERIYSENGVRRVLVDCLKVHFPPSTIHLYDHGTCLAKSSAMRQIKHALVVPEEIVKDAHFLETVSNNRGVRMRHFTTRAEALEWLNE